MTDHTIRDMEPADRDAVIDLIWELNRHENALTGDRATDRASARACLSANDAKVREFGGRHIVAIRGGSAIGYACVAIVEGEPYLREDIRRYGYVLELVVTAAARGKGIGAALLTEAERFVRGMGLDAMGIGVLAANVDAARLYDRLGFKPQAVERLKWLD